MRTGYKKAFNDHKKLDFLINLRLYGYSIGSLALLFHCDKKAIRMQCDRYFVFPEAKPMSLGKIIKSALAEQGASQRPWKLMDGERVNKGYSYAEYLERYSYSPFKGRRQA